MLIELNVYAGSDDYSDDKYGLCDGVEITVKPNSRYCDTLDILDLLEEAIYEALESAEIEVEDE